MLFNSFDFGFFLVIIYAAYWLIGSKERIFQNILLLAASYLFYGLWDWRFLALLVASSLVDFVAGIALEKTNRNRMRLWILLISIFWNLGILITFKYFDFFIDNFAALFSLELSQSTYTIWNVIVPLGLSFYTFQTMGYSIDVYRKKIPATKNLIEFLCFVSFFPQLVAGPIERAKKLLPQFENVRKFDIANTKAGLRQILWGLFKKILVADKLGVAVTMVFSNPEGYGSLMLIFGAVLFCFQVYCDFSGYTDIAIGTARLFGFRLSKNFEMPYLSKSITELWQRWHITLTQWFTDYVYAPFVKNANRASNSIRALGLLITLLLVGLWHGANWTFVAFGLFNGFILVLERIPLFKRRATLLKKLQAVPRICSLAYVFIIFTISAVFFRASSIDQAWIILKRIFTFSPDLTISSLIGFELLYLVFLLVAEMATRKWDFPFEKIETKIPTPIRWTIYYALIILIIRYAEPKEAFIYFQF